MSRWPMIAVLTLQMMFKVADQFLAEKGEYENGLYMGCLLVSDPSFCQQLSMLLRHYLGWTIEQIGGLDVSDTL